VTVYDDTWRYFEVRPCAPELERSVLFLVMHPFEEGPAQQARLRQCEALALSWGYGFVTVAGRFALCVPDPILLAIADDPVGPRTDDCLRACLARADLVVCVWGTGEPFHLQRATDVYVEIILVSRI
jgi:hypothetical protein